MKWEDVIQETGDPTPERQERNSQTDDGGKIPRKQLGTTCYFPTARGSSFPSPSVQSGLNQ